MAKTLLRVFLIAVTMIVGNAALRAQVTCPASNEVMIDVVDDPTISITGATTICAGGTATLTATTAGGSGTCTIQWQSSADGSSGWVNVDGANAATYTTPAMSTTTYYRATYGCSGLGCDPAVSNTQAVTVVPDPTISEQPTGGSLCAGGEITMTVTATGGTPGLTYQWQYNNGGTWANVTNSTPTGATYTGATSASLTVSGISTVGTHDYRVLINASGNGCTQAVSATTTVTVGADLAITTQPSDINECVGGTNQLTVVVANGSGTISYQWQSSANGSSGWANVSGATLSTYTPPSTSAGTTYYRVIASASNNGCDPVVSNNAAVVVSEDLAITTQPSDINECVGGTNQLTVVVANGSGTISYQWQSSANGSSGWANVSGATLSTYTPPSTSAGTTYYRVITSASNNGCDPVVSNNAAVVIAPDLAITTQPSDINECVGGTNQLTVVVANGSGTISYQWQSSANGSSGWANVSGATLSTYTPPSTSAGTTYYRVITSASNNGCDPVVSNNAAVVIAEDLAITTQPSDINECVGGTNQLTVVVANGSGTISYQWQSSANGSSSWANVSGATLSTYTPPSTSAGTTYYRVVVSAANNGCDPVVSNNAAVVIAEDLAITTQPQNISECVGGTDQLSVVVSNGSGSITYQWQSSANGTSGWANVSGATTSNYLPPSTTAGTTYYRVIVSAGNGGCEPVVSEVATVTINPDPTVSVTGVGQVCIGAEVTLNATSSGGAGNCYIQWQVTTNGGSSWNDVSGATGPTYTTPALTSDTGYRAIVICAGSGCCN